MTVALLTERRYEQPDDVDAYVGNILLEDRLLSDALARRGVETERVDWSRPDVDWEKYEAAVFRTTWDYFERLPEFVAWLDRVQGRTRFLNPLAQVRWNLDKHYLAELADRGVPTVPTRFVEPGAATTLGEAVAAVGTEVVIKPAVSGAARHTHRVRPGESDALEPLWRRLLADEAWMVQPFLPDVIERGELALMVLGGRVTHAVLKRARPGDFRVQDDHGGTVHAHTPSVEEVAFAETAVAACPSMPAYARVDLVRDGGQLVVMELELIEPELFLRQHPPAAEALADTLLDHLGARPGPLR